ncbi:hypothetical protein V1520DRAFT_349886 [Lipomyces starkeyi]|uniref:SMODS and SLOG-associating 2TM effector domain-containing protein n=1 Tax=Lipomyces starkeyi NRRL Y-11557 TaxID=675824 RepID=A0A1E3Q2D9_LIPST|nr:hypothetical protein LIPSTDRAFT_331049 [Lipomyces starkeyi NRRL Y-11557]
MDEQATVGNASSGGNVKLTEQGDLGQAQTGYESLPQGGQASVPANSTNKQFGNSGNQSPLGSGVVDEYKTDTYSLSRPTSSLNSSTINGEIDWHGQKDQHRSSALVNWFSFPGRHESKRRTPIDPSPQGQKNALLNDIDKNLGGNHYMALLYLSWFAVLTQTACSAVATALVGSKSNNVVIVIFTVSATVSGALVALFKNSGEPQLSLQRKVELDHLKLKVEAVDANISRNNGPSLATVLSTLSSLRQEYERIDKQTSSAYVGVMSSISTTAANRTVGPSQNKSEQP